MLPLLVPFIYLFPMIQLPRCHQHLSTTAIAASIAFQQQNCFQDLAIYLHVVLFIISVKARIKREGQQPNEGQNIQAFAQLSLQNPISMVKAYSLQRYMYIYGGRFT